MTQQRDLAPTAVWFHVRAPPQPPCARKNKHVLSLSCVSMASLQYDAHARLLTEVTMYAA